MSVGAGQVPLDAVIITEELDRRPSRPPDYETESRSLAALMDVMANASGVPGADRVLQELVETALKQCHAGSAGVSLLEERENGAVFRWRAAAGRWRPFLGETMPRANSPCGTVLDRNTTLLMRYPERHFTYEGEAPAIAETLIVPFHAEGRPVGTVWIIAHDDNHHFDDEDRRFVTRLAQFAAAACHLLEAQELRSKLADARLLQAISAELVHQDDIVSLYERLLDAAIKIADADCASIQRFDADEGGGALTLLANRGFTPEAAEYWASIRMDGGSPCGQALRSVRRAIFTDLEKSLAQIGPGNLAMFRQTNIRSCQSTPLMSRTGRLVGMMSTHWRKPHEPLERDLLLLDILARQASDLIEQKHATDALREADRRKDAFLATLAHELRNPLAPLSNATRILKLADGGSSEAEWARGVIERQVRHMTRLVDDLLDIGRIMRDSLELRREPVELAAALRAAIETSSPLIDERGHELIVTKPAKPVIIDGDATRLAQVFANLLNNAAQYMEPGGRIVLVAARAGSEAVVSVTDTGRGIALERLPHIFEHFKQARVAQGSVGMGLGLTIVKRLVEMHGGSVTANSPGVGAGSTFTVRLPAVPVTQPAPGKIAAALAAVPGARRVLVVDDNEDSASTLVRVLERHGYEAHTVGEADSALEAAASLRPDAMVLNIGTGGLDGYEVARHIRAESWGRDVMLIAVTGWGRPEDQRRSAEAGFDHHLVKPVEFEVLAQMLARPGSEPSS